MQAKDAAIRRCMRAGRGKGAPQIGLRLPPPELAAVDAWIKDQPKPRPSRPVAIRRLVELGLKGKAGKIDA